MSRSCDPKCYELARYFLAGEHLSPMATYELACDLQEKVEDFIKVARREHEEAGVDQ